MQIRIGGKTVDASHELWYYRGFYYCGKCCGMATLLVRALGEACRLVPHREAKRRVDKIRRGLLPQQYVDWPDTPLLKGGRPFLGRDRLGVKLVW